MSSEPNNVTVGILWMILTGILFVCVTGIVRHLGSDIPAIQAAFIRYVFGLLMVAPLMLKILRSPPSLPSLKIYGLRGLVHGLGVMLWFFAMARIPVAEVTAIGYVAPIFVTLGAVFFFGERLALRRILAIIIGFIGTLIILRPGFQEINIGQLAQLAAAPAFAASFLLTKQLTREADAATIVGMLSLVVTLVLLPGALAVWRTPTGEELLWLAATAAFATAGHYTLTKAIAAAPLTVTQPISYLQLVWATLLGIFMFNEPLDPFVLLGGAIIVGAATFISHRERMQAKAEITPPAVATKI